MLRQLLVLKLDYSQVSITCTNWQPRWQWTLSIVFKWEARMLCMYWIGLYWFCLSFDASNWNRILKKLYLRMTFKWLCSLREAASRQAGGSSPRIKILSRFFTCCIIHRLLVRGHCGYKPNGVFMQSIIFSGKHRLKKPKATGVPNEWLVAQLGGTEPNSQTERRCNEAIIQEIQTEHLLLRFRLKVTNVFQYGLDKSAF